jgi:SAM-dependent methyltransferase
MTEQGADRQAHWSRVYQTKAADSVSWYRPHLQVSLELLEEAGLSPASRVIDIGGGASTLVDDLLARGVADITVLDLSPEALAVSRERLGDRAPHVRWLAADLLHAELPEAAYDLWHDRAVLHFLTEPADVRRYASQARMALRKGGHAVIGGFSPDGPERCSGLLVARRSAEEIAGVLGPGLTLLAQRHERHVTPAGSEQSFAYALLRRD